MKSREARSVRPEDGKNYKTLNLHLSVYYGLYLHMLKRHPANKQKHSSVRSWDVDIVLLFCTPLQPVAAPPLRTDSFLDRTIVL